MLFCKLPKMRDKNGQRIILEKAIIENHKRYVERINFYKNFGYDIEEERRFILEKARPLYGDILEVGTGKGYLTLALAREGHKFTTVDISAEEQEFARLNIKHFGLEQKVDFLTRDARHLDFKDGSFDIVISLNMVHHLVNPFAVVDELTRVLKNEGRIVLGDFSKAGLALVNKLHKNEGKTHRVGLIGLNDIAKYLLSKGCKLEKDRTSFQEILVVYKKDN